MADSLAQQQNKAMSISQEIILKQVMNEFGSQLNTVIQNNALLNLPEFKIDQRSERVAESVNSGTRGRNGGVGALLGGAVGAGIGLFGGPAGAAAGFGIGSTVGGWFRW